MAPNNLVDILRSHAQARPEALAYTFLRDGETIGEQLSFADLDTRARALGATLQHLTSPGDRALLLYQAGLDFVVAFLACQYAGVVAVPSPPPNMNRAAATITRLAGIVASAEPAIVLTTAAQLPALRSATRGQAAYAGLIWQASDRVDLGRAAVWTPPTLGADELSFLQYTSGSTSAPKGVMVSHHNIISNLAMLRETMGSAKRCNMVSWLPVFHDMGLIGMVLYGLYAGTETRLMSPLSFLKRPMRWLRAIADHGDVISGGPNFAFDAVLRRVTDADKQGLDLSRWQSAFCGAETVRVQTMARFYETFAECGLRREALLPCYGLAEATLVVSGRTPGRSYQIQDCDKTKLEQGVAQDPGEGVDAHSVVSCGSTKLDQDIAIVDPERRRARAEGEVGEIWVRGDNVARGYWGEPERTAETFAATTLDGDGPFLRTGDLGFSIAGELFVTGRIKELILVRGRCIYPQDLELMVDSMADEFPEIVANQNVAFALPDAQQERSGLIVKVARRNNPAYDAERLVEAIQARALAEFELSFGEIALVRSSVPKTSSGKKMRTACAAQMKAGLEDLALEHRWRRGQPKLVSESPSSARSDETHTQAQLAELVVEWIAREEQLDVASISTRQPFTELGLDSFVAVSMIEFLERELGTTISSTIFEDHRTIDELTKHLSSR
ncbi:AMP-binding protein [Enhygromyxa salina]|uniref:Long-chain-fatty-acid--AMP ligase FadD29 n=1 Tax=Enhygromyxa salina TaxID=215803 RepID=A0A2S9YTU2_9BACT|nr:AMP-binding protein [Enhygromyxa salina]PRQ08535.1 Long-chain-fatty-acid--AMP ligase FadD29 [Enhygromyxa salina]